MKEETDLDDLTAVIYIRNTKTGQLCRFNADLDDAETLDEDGKAWHLILTTTTPMKWVRTAKEN